MALLAGGEVLLHDLDARTTRCVSPAGCRQTDLRFSSGGSSLSYARDGELFRYHIASNREDRLTHDASATCSNGVADFIAQEEMHRFDGHWWGSNDEWLVYTHVDVSPIPIAHRYEFSAGALRVQDQRYPYAGAQHARVELRMLRLRDGLVTVIDWADDSDDYLARVHVAGSTVAVQVQSRDQRRLRLKLYACENGLPMAAAQTALEEHSDSWINLHDNLKFLANQRDFLWTSERAGNARLYLYRGEAPIELTKAGRVTRVIHATQTCAFFVGWTDTPTQQHVYQVDFDAPYALRQLTNESGWHDASFDTRSRWFVDRFASTATPPKSAAGSSRAVDSSDRDHGQRNWPPSCLRPVSGQPRAADIR
ncbi:MAG: hypothetical protein HC809_13110 [Gammaproteobacteria bacterium]|nr:hypothetical protein [Gammaproteobacteria bacterium]